MFEQAFQRINTALIAVLDSEQAQWLEAGLTKIANSEDLSNELLNRSAMTRRKLGQQFFDLDIETLQLDGYQVLGFHHWTYADAGRALFILQAVNTASAELSPMIIRDYFQQGDESEVAVIIRILILFDNAGQYKPFASEVGRTNSMPLYAALAQYNPYPAQYYTDHEFNQLVLKALFMGIAIAPISNFHKRANAELSLMCVDYIKERLAASRSIPVDIWLALEPYANAEASILITNMLADELAEQRYFVVKALLQQDPLTDERRQLLANHRIIETDPRVLALLDDI